jgi:hypothetical protein
MRYELKSSASELRPKAALVLANVRPEALFYSGRGQRHPLGVFNLTFSEIVRAMRSVLDELEAARTSANYASPKNYDWHRQLLTATDHMLDSIIQHLDSYGTIIEALFENKDAEGAKKIKKSVHGEIRSYRDRVAKIVNAIKHNHRKLAPFYFHNVGLFVPGYFVEGVCENGAIGPDPLIHGQSNTAISFNRDLPFHIVNLYFAAAVLGGAVQGHTKAKAEVTDGGKTDADTELAEVFRRLSILPHMFFPDEVSMPMPVVDFRKKAGSEDFTVTLECPASRSKPQRVPSGSHCQASWSGDGASTMFKVPYWG